MSLFKTLSILGDSVSTYKGVSNDSEANYTIINNPYFYKPPFPLEKTYWSLVMASLELTLCVNNSWSGGNLSDKSNPNSGVSRARYLTRNDGTCPDVVIVFMGLNDLGRSVDDDVFTKDYKQTLLTIKENHPNAIVCCINMPDRDEFFKKRAIIFNSIIEDIVKSMGENFFIADLFNSPLNNDNYYINTVDGLHPDEDGMKIIAGVVIDAIKSKIKSLI